MEIKDGLILQVMDLLGIIKGAIEQPTTKHKVAKWKTKDLHAKTEILMHLTDRQVDLVKNLESSKPQIIRHNHKSVRNSTKTEKELVLKEVLVLREVKNSREKERVSEREGERERVMIREDIYYVKRMYSNS